MSFNKDTVEKNYLQSHIFHDSNSNFTLNLSGFPLLTNLEHVVKKKYHHSVYTALQKMAQIESGKIVNQTAVKEESENRAVDHFNLRLDKELVPGKSLSHSLKLWNDIKQKVDAILSGEVKNENGDSYTDVIFNGIGGSYLGPLMLIIAMKGDGYNNKPDNNMKLHFVANTDPDSFHVIMSKLDLQRSIMVNMSKSGSTAETKGNMETFFDVLKVNSVKSENIGKYHNIAITTKGSKFDKFAQEQNFMHIFYMNEETGGRTSVCSAIGMVPCAFASLSFDQFLYGQSYMDEMTRRENALQNPAMLVAIGIDVLSKEYGKKNMIVLGYSDFLKEFAHYLQQLYMESLGKEYNDKGVNNPEGQTVFGGIGTGEQHAFMQQVQKGIPDCFVRFIHFLKRRHDFPNQNAGSMGRQLLGFVKGTEHALLGNGKPFITSTFEQCNMFNMGMMVAMEERIVTILAAFRDINAYDQPGVQDGKVSANSVNNYSLQIEKEILGKLQCNDKWSWSGDADNARNEFKVQSAPVWFVDAILSDIYANVSVKNSYSHLFNKITVQRTFDKSRFVYSISSKL